MIFPENIRPIYKIVKFEFVMTVFLIVCLFLPLWPSPYTQVLDFSKINKLHDCVIFIQSSV